MPAYLSPAEVAERLGMPRRRVYEAISTFDLAATNLGAPGRAYYRVSEGDLEAWLQRRYRPAR